MEIYLKHTESHRFQIITEYLSGKLLRVEASELLDCSERTVTRLAAKIRSEGVLGVKNGNYGKEPRNKKSAGLRDMVVSLVKDLYFDFNVTHLLEKLRDSHGIDLSYSTLYRWCRDEKLVKAPRRTRRKPKKARPRMRREGYILQMDGSHHRFNRVDNWCLISAIDDATSKIVHAEFFDGETTKNCLQFLKDLVLKNGIPRAIYTDKAGWLAQGKRENFSHFIAACEKLGIKILFASSPEAKGRVERSFRTIQDRLIPEMRINGIKSMKEANFYLKNTFIREYWNKKNVIPPVDPETAFIELSQDVDLDEICAFEFDRKIAKDQTISWKGKKYPVSSKFLPDLRGFNANIRVLLNGDMRIFVMGRKIESEGLTKPAKEPFKPKEDTDFDKAMRTFYFRYVNQVYCELREHLATGFFLKKVTLKA